MKSLIKDEDITIEFFDDDPDCDPDRAGDGYYFQLPGETDWSGPWHSREEALRIALDELNEQTF